ncbi:LysR family transcriptional regulator [Pseudoalteromonas agarivorans]|jgi:DNA-binding transcriptional LysR family regulator|uniref:LysR family transcriptional regulator n=2 Tax=Pseudoalteromonas TaxID=53246 RepID=A0AAD0U244_9GAMM|nr:MULTISPECIES: LysR family transcriptional regulator [Pseudoalteromonas]AYM87576.1 LysR family transcriptional regulator [Pseudoalteromonas agarivorans]AZN33695.1 LysR family transcriptional regulator [Pseudoalteromonas sp. Xi13]KYL35083.1 LysR family transcriptional regulator [Pseudoalteromonas telluritireducens]MCK8096720.1 LysR family transcriptional regulator [Pseudoalteromonas sp. 1CM17D]MCW1719566.1 LysR family transcriptional regulator [Pseudoalteromonas sp. A3]|tara:strand:+ start:10346 stop:11194 length:849 start_codon:yes stop_codon:yes gene_type:complete
MKNISTDSLRTFVMVVEVGGFAKAGDLLGLSQPAVSLQIKRLEDLLGYKLFKKQGQRQVLNQYGELLLPMAKQMMQYNDAILQQFTSESITGKVRLGIPSEFAARILPSIIGDFVSLYPEVSLEVKSRLSKHLLSASRQDQFDLVLALNERLNSDKFPIFMQDELVWVGDLAQAKNEVVTLVTAPEGCIYRRRATDALKSANIKYRIVYSNADLTGLIAALKEGLGITVLAKSTVPSDLNFQAQSKYLPALGSIGISLIKSGGESEHAVDKLAEFIALRLGY